MEQDNQAPSQATDAEVAGSLKVTQADIDKQRKEAQQNDDMINEIKKDIEESMPFVSELMDVQILKEEYRENQFEACFDAIKDRYSKVRRMRKDGSCFYRSFLYQMFEYFIIHKEDVEAYNKFTAKVEGSKERLIQNGYEEMAIEDFYDSFIEAVKGLKDVEAANCDEHL
jgi:ubiquitin thioesterase protein OTUB1